VNETRAVAPAGSPSAVAVAVAAATSKVLGTGVLQRAALIAVASPARRGARDARVFDRDVTQELQALGLLAESGASNSAPSVRWSRHWARRASLAAAHENGEAQQLGRAPWTAPTCSRPRRW
jgi:hypothetical protein